MEKYYLYILFSEELDKFYIGYCKNLEERLRKHNTNHKGYTGKANDWKIAYLEEFDTKTEAYARERAIKKWKSRKRIEELLKQ